jgi:pimeloyl-ACP methyl ester carboxylesterase
VRPVLRDVLRHRVPGCEPGVELALIEWPGAGPPALLHHANGFCAALWAPVAELLAAHFRVFAVDARGPGDSSRPAGDEAYRWRTMARDLGCAADRVLARTGADAIALGVGHSFGGTLTMAAAAGRPGRYQRAILIDPVILPRAALAQQRARQVENPMADRARKRRHQWASRDEARRFFADKPLFADWPDRAIGIYVDEALADVADGVELKCPGRVEAAIFAGGGDFDPYAVAEKAHLPIRVARATRGDFTRAAYDELVAHLPEGDLVEIEGGHLVVMERPEVVSRAILEFAGVG